MCERTDLNDLIDWTRLEEAECWGGVILVLRCPDIYDPVNASLLRRFTCACCRGVQLQLMEEASCKALDVIERFAHGSASFEELVDARNAAKLAARRVCRRRPRSRHACAASEAVRDAGRNNAFEALLLSCRAAERAGLSIQKQAELFQKTYRA